jgi:hypothetical protein
MPQVGESDIGLFHLSFHTYVNRLAEYAGDAPVSTGTGERNFLPFIPWLSRGERVSTFDAEHRLESVGVNTPEELIQVEEYLEGRDGGEHETV